MTRLTLRLIRAVITSALAAGTLAVGAAPSASAGPGGSAFSAEVGTASMYLSDCLWGPYGPEPLDGPIVPSLVKSHNCIAVTLYTGEDNFEGGSAQINLPAGISISKKVAGPSGGMLWAPPSDCWWSGSFSVLASGKAQTLRLNNLWCDPDETVVAYFSARIANPVDVDYMGFTAENRLSVWHQIYETDSCSPIWTGFPYLFGAVYQYTGAYTPVKYGTVYQLNNANYWEPMPFMIAPDYDYFRWWQWLDVEYGGCFGP